MKKVFKILSVILIIMFSFAIISYAIIFFGLDEALEAAGEAGINTSPAVADRVVGIFIMAGIIVVAYSVSGIITGILGLRERYRICKNFALIFLILECIGLAISILSFKGIIKSAVWVAFFAVYHHIAKKCTIIDLDF